MVKFTRDELVAELREGVCNVQFEKVNGDFRDMSCTLNTDLMPESARPKTDDEGVQATLDVVKVYDVKAEGWRSFKVDKVLAFNGNKA